MRIIKNELIKVYRTPLFCLLFILFLAGNFLLISTLPASEYYSKTSYRQLYSDIHEMSGNERAAYIEDTYIELTAWDNFEKNETAPVYTDDMFSEYMLFRDFFQEIEQLSNYDTYIEDSLRAADQTGEVAIFNNSSDFSRRNAKKTASALLPLSGSKLQYTNSRMLNTVMEFHITDIFLLLLIFVIATILIADEKEKQHFILLRPAKNGRTALISAKMGALFILCISLVSALYTSSFLASGLQYGLPDFSVKIQSVYGFDSCALNVTVWQYLLIFYSSKAAVSVMFGLIFFFIAITAESSNMLYIKTIILFAVSIALNLLIPGNSAFQILKYANLIYFMRTTPVYQYYFNLNILGWPVNISTVFAVMTTLTVSVFFILNIYYFAAKELSPARSSRLPLVCRHTPAVHVSLIYHELYKIFIVNKVLVTLLLLIAFQIYNISARSSYVSIDEYFYKQYATALEGPLDAGKLKIIAQEKQDFAQLERLLDETEQRYVDNQISDMEYTQTQNSILEQLRGREGFEILLEQLAHIEANDGAWLIYKTGWEELSSANDPRYKTDLLLALSLLLTLIASFPAVFCNEYSTGMIDLTRSCRNGRTETVRTKIRLCTIITSGMFFINYIPELISIQRQYGLDFPTASISSIPGLADFPLPLRLWHYVLILYLIRFISTLSILYLILFISVRVRTVMHTIVILFALLVIPLALSLSGIDMIQYFSLNIFFSGNLYLNALSSSPVSGFLIGIPVCIGAYSLFRLEQES